MYVRTWVAGADGSAKKIIVSDWIKNTAGSSSLDDSTELKDVTNVKGEQGYTMNGDNARIWDAAGGDIYYQGSIEKDLPVSLKVSYQLDGNPISAEDLAGKPALFKVTIKKIEKKVLPEIDDELAQDVSDFDTLDEYKADIKAKLTEDKEKDAKSKKENDVVEKIIENATMDIADDMIAAQAERMLNEYAQNLQMQGLSFDMYMKYTGMTVEQLLDQMKPQALKRIQARLVLEAVAVAEKFDVTDEDLDAKCEEIGKMYGMELDKVKETFGEEGLNQIKEDIKVEKAADFVRDNAVEK